jgi:4-amino-4-deoxy-L-arabinose transferase-like glycosyltransferase
VQLDTGEIDAKEGALFRPEEAQLERWLTVAVFLVAFGYLLIFRHYTTIEPDEGIVLQGAQRILRGEVLYRDFFSFLTPGSFYFQALLFKLFGNSFVVPRVTLAVLGGFFSAIGYLLARRACNRSTALIAAALLTLTTLPYRFLALHNWDSTLLACLAVYCAVRMLDSPHGAWAFAVASLTSLTFLFEQSKGVGLGLGLVLGFASVHLLRVHRFEFNRSNMIALMGGLAWPFVLTVTYFASRHALGQMLFDWEWPLQHYSTANHVPYGFANWSEEARHQLFASGPLWVRILTGILMSPYFLIPALPPVAVLFLAYGVHRSWRNRNPDARQAYYLMVTGALSGLLLAIVVVRADIIHFMYLLPLYGLVLAWILDGRDIPSRLFATLHPIVNAYLIFSFLIFSVPLLLRAVNPPFKIETRRGIVAMPGRDTVLEYVPAHVAPGGELLVYPYLPLYNYLTATFSPAPLDYFQPGMNTAEQGEMILKELRSGRVKAVLFEPSFPQKIPTSWPETPLSAIVSDPVADYIVANYKPCEMLLSPEWAFEFMVAKGSGCP